MTSPTVLRRYNWRLARAAHGFRFFLGGLKANMSRCSVNARLENRYDRMNHAPMRIAAVFRSCAGPIAFSCGMVLLSHGCASPQRWSLQYAVRQIDGVDRDAVFAVAQQALVDEGLRLDRTDSASGIITTHPTEVEIGALRARNGSRFRSTSRLRRIAEVRLAPTATGQAVYCTVAIQQQASEAYRMFRHEAAGSDVPNETAIEREAATTVEQNTIWQTIRRDRATERRILDAIVKQTLQPRP